jgi:hypothetical protein
LTGKPSVEHGSELVGIAEGSVELARGIEPPTCGLQIPLKPLSLLKMRVLPMQMTAN